MKRCPGCNDEKPTAAFARDRTKRDGRQTQCRACRKARYYDPEYGARYRETHRDRLNAQARRRYDPEKERVRSAANSEANVRRATEWNRAHPERTAARRRAWVERHPDRVRASRWRSNEQRRGTRPTGEARNYTMILAGDPCSYCGGPADEIDHIVPVALGGAGEWDNLTAACGDCNRAKSAKPLLGFLAARVT